jgi:hypothetical protein
MSEAGASLVDMKLGLGVVPKTRVSAPLQGIPVHGTIAVFSYKISQNLFFLKDSDREL